MTENRCMNCMRKRTDSGGACPYCGFDPGKYKPPEQTLPPGTTLNHGKYIIGRVLGRGGFGVTYVALDTTLDLRVAVKECIPRNCAWRNDSGASVQWGLSVPEQEMMLESFVKEARKMAKIDQIPGVVRVREYFYDNETAYIVMDYVDGETLREYLKRKGPLNAEACFRVLAPAMDSLAQAHKRGLIHRDISPNNIMIETNGERVWVLDLGAAKDLGTRISAPNVSADTRIVGTPDYTPLEQYSPDGKIGPWTDVYAMSSTFFRCMTGQKLPPSTSRALKDDAPELLRTIRGPVGAVLEKGLAQNPEERYQSMSELRDALEKAIDDTAQAQEHEDKTEVLVNPPPQAERTETLPQSGTPKAITETPPRKKRMLAPILLLCIALALVPLGIMLTRSKSVTPGNESQTLEDTAVSESADTSESNSEEIVLSGECGDNVSWTLYKNIGRLTISGTGDMTDYEDSFSGQVAPWADYKNSISYVEILDGVTKIGNYAFYQFYALQVVEIPDGLTEIGYAAFCECYSLAKVVIPDSVTKIDTYAFLACSRLTNVEIPESVTEIGDSAFGSCSSLTNIAIPNGVTTISGGTFGECSALTSVLIPDSVTEIGDGAFSKCTNLISVTIPDSVTKIGSRLFQDCTALTEINIPSGVTQIDSSTFAGCISLSNVTIPGNVLEIRFSAFDSCINLKQVTISEGVTVILDFAFGGCTSLESVTLPNSMYRIGEFAFVGCTGLTNVTIPDSVAAIEEGAFQGCTNLKSVSVSANTLLTNAFDETTVVTRR